MSIWTDGAPDGGEVTLGGAAHELPAPVSRNLYTNNSSSNVLTAASNAISPANAGAYSLADFGLTGATGEPTIGELIRWMRGEDIRNEDFDPSTTVRNVMGDPLHSQPAAVVYGGSPSSPDVVVFTGTNDGYLHAVDGDTGQELWSFVPKELLNDMNRLFFDPKSNFKHYGIDGNIVPVINDRDGDGNIEPGDDDFVYLLFGMRRGGSSFYALDVTNKNAPTLLWQAQYPEFGQSWSTPVVTRMNINAAGLNADQAVVVLGGGYDPVHDTRAHPAAADVQGAGIHILDLESGARLWRAGRDAGADLQLSSMTRAIPTQVRVIDMSGDGFADR
ncbi:MAG: pilus assembly protein PilY, partial [Woeseiaceae bacterium]